MLGGLSDPTPFPWPEHVGFVDAETMHPLDASADPLQRALSGNRLHKETHLLRRVNDSDPKRYVRVDSARLEAENSEPLVVLVIDDVSNEERNRQVVERKSRLDALGQLTGGIAHDFNNLLTSLLYSVVLAGRTDDAVERNENLKEAENSINRARSLTARLLTFARKQPGLADGRSVQKIFGDFERLIRPMMEASIDIQMEADDSDLVVYADQTQLESALLNLVLNSRDAILRAGKGNRIQIRARPMPSSREGGAPAADDEKHFRFVEISVTDNGPGMDEETLARATDPFFTTKDTNSGTGLGLAMVYGFARQSEGDLRIYSEEGVGTTIQLTLPRGAEEGQREEPVVDDEIVPGQGQTILIVEDEFHILSVTSKLLREIGYDVITAASGQEAFELTEAGTSFDLLLSDVVMPGKVGGFELAKRVRKIRPNVPVIYMSGYTGFTASEMGEVIAPLLQKPSPPADLSRALADALKGA
ncbi:MAG: ATP-binding protein [Litoreibacter sp.]|nr:ATP-binding protein [Litoreibacter sp.]